MINRNSRAYQAGRLFGKFLLIGAGYLVGKPIDKSFPEKKDK